MALHFTRYSKIYSQIARPDVAQSFPRHVFTREANSAARKTSFAQHLLVKHENVLDSTLIHLTEPYDNSEIFIVGTTNHSDILANRTKKLIQEVKPDVVFVQTDEKWWKGAQHLRHVKSQEEMSLAMKDLQESFKVDFDRNLRTMAYKFRWSYFVLFSKLFFGLPNEYNPFAPGLEVKYALEEANSLDSKIVYLGYEFDENSARRFYHENRYSIMKTLINSWKFFNQVNYAEEYWEFKEQLHNYGLKKFLESSCDQFFINWVIQVLDKMLPDVKRILIEKKEEDLFKNIMQNRGKRMVCLVNQIHMEGLEHHWCHSFGQTPRNVRFHDIDPIGDMPLRSMLFSQMYHVIMRDVKTSRSRNTPASYTNNVNPYWREFNMQYEHRNM